MDIQKWFIDPILTQYSDFTGRATRQQYWMFVLCNIVAYIVVAIVGGVLSMPLLVFIFSLAVWVPGIAIAARRLHDINMSGWWQLLFLIPLVGIVLLLVWMCRKGDVGPNQYGNPVMIDGMSPVTPTMPDAMPMTPPAAQPQSMEGDGGKMM